MNKVIKLLSLCDSCLLLCKAREAATRLGDNSRLAIQLDCEIFLGSKIEIERVSGPLASSQA